MAVRMDAIKAEALFAERAIHAAVTYLFRVEHLRVGDPRFDRLSDLFKEYIPEAFSTALRQSIEATAKGMDDLARDMLTTDAMLCGILVARLALTEKSIA